jgi:hypothetical protein
MDIKEFGVESWMDRYEDHCEFNLAETCVESLYMHELLAMTGTTGTFLDGLRDVKLTYGAIEGSVRCAARADRVAVHLANAQERDGDARCRRRECTGV